MRRKNASHAFRFMVEGQSEPAIVMAKVIKARTKVVLLLTATDVRRALELKGCGNTQKCAGAICVKRHKDAFRHPVDGYVDWQYRTAYVVSKTKNRLPHTCVAYEHYDNTAHLFDTVEGLQQLLKELEEQGPRRVTLLPPRQRASQAGQKKPQGERTRTRAGKAHSVLGARLRYAIATLGVSGNVAT